MNRQYLFLFQQFNKISNTYKSSYNRADCLSSKDVYKRQARIFAKWLELPTLNEINDLIETGFVQTTTRRTISLHPMIQEITLTETKPSVSS